MAIRATIDKAGNYPVVQDPCPYFKHQKVITVTPRAGVLHTTEINWGGAMRVFKEHYAPHFIVGLNAKKKPQISQLVPVGTIGAALRAHNNLAIVQIEMVGHSEAHPWLPGPETLDALCSLMLVCRREWGIPLTHPWKDGDFGKADDNPHRHSGKYGHVSGWFGHGDVPLPDVHWDPGSLKWSEVFEHATSLDKPAGGVPVG